VLVCELGDPKVKKFDTELFTRKAKAVRWFDITVNDPDVVSGMEGIANLPANLFDDRPWKATLFP